MPVEQLNRKDCKRVFKVRPIFFSDVSKDMSIAKEEIFGPVLSIMTNKTEAEAIEIANSTAYGLLGMVWAADEERAKNIALQVDSGQVCINGRSTNELVPRGGHKSGLGYENGKVAIQEYLEDKALNY